MALADRAQMGISIPQIFPDGHMDMALVRQFVARAEALGYHSLWTQEQVLGKSPILEPISLLNYTAAVTSTAKLGVAVMVLSMRNPVQLAKSLASLDQMSGGRLVVGLGMATSRHYVPIVPLQDRRIARFLEWFRVMKGLWTEPEFSLYGDFWQIEGASMEPKPVQKPHPPVWFGGAHPDALRRAVLHADGWMGAGSTSIESFVELMPVVRQHLEEAGRDPATFAVSKRVYIAVDDDQARAERKLRDWFAGHYRNADLAAKVGVAGTPEHCAERIAEVVDAGVGMVMLNPVYDQMEHLEALAELVGLK
jgi:alkanesulfonate monooxygenase SsuD/methylene tetrahydromethanopterin reductase-like flavin-dependent oxidoreductase (luciferase family)